MALIQVNPGYEALIRETANPDYEKAMAAQYKYAQTVAETIRKGVLVGDINRIVFNQAIINGDYMEFSLDMLQPGEEDEYIAYTIPATGKIPESHIEGDYVRIPLYEVGNAIDWDLRFAERGDSFQMGRIEEIFQAGFTKKMNDDGMQTLIAAAADRNILIYDADAGAGQFTKRAVSLAKVAMKRNGGGNSASMKRSKLTDILCSPEAEEDVRGWGIDQIPDAVRTRIYDAQDGSNELLDIYGVFLHPLDEFGENQVYQDFYLNTLGAFLQASDVELAIGVDLLNKDSFYNPSNGGVQVFNDLTKHRLRRAGIYGWVSNGVGIVDSRRVICISF
jgi:hypothetical protein